ncbi:hypothetical protein ACWGOQ_0000720 [Aquimarina sp. M1]
MPQKTGLPEKDKGSLGVLPQINYMDRQTGRMKDLKFSDVGLVTVAGMVCVF